MYRTPPTPGYLGEPARGAVIAFLVGALLSNVAATQAVAWRFAYHAGLGAPLARLGGVGIYQPFAWFAWAHLQPHDARARLMLTVWSFGTLAIGLLITFAVSSALNASRLRRLSAGAEDLHGSARWASRDDVEAGALLRAHTGVYVGGWFDRQARRLRYLRHNGPEHILAFAPTRSGKGVGLVIPTLLAWSESAVIYDIKGENWAKTAGFRASQGHVCFKFSPVEDGTSSRFNPLAEMRIGTRREVSDAQNIADMLVKTGGDSPSERYWQDAAASITAGMILHVCYAAAAKGKTACLADLAAAFVTPEVEFDDTLRNLLAYPHDPQLTRGWKTATGASTPTHPTVRVKVQEMLDKADKDRSGVLSTTQTALALFADPLVAANTAASDFRIHDLVNHERPVSLYLVVPPSDKIRLRPLMRLIFTMIVNRLTERMDFEGTAQVRPAHRLLFLIDEFPSLHRMELFADALSYMAGYGLKAYLIAQDLCQIVEEYGQNQSLVSNCHIRIAYAPNHYETAALLSRMTGQQTIQRAAFSFSGKKSAPALSNLTANVENIERPLLTPDEVMRIRPAKKEGEGTAERITEPGEMLIFVSGQHPIYGRQILYFVDPVLAARAAIAAPSQLYMIEEGQIVAQPTIHRTPNAISAPEAPPLAPMLVEPLAFAMDDTVEPDRVPDEVRGDFWD